MKIWICNKVFKGITKMAEGEAKGTQIVGYAWKYECTEVGKVIYQWIPAEDDTTQLWESKVLFKLYDDGWHLEDTE